MPWIKMGMMQGQNWLILEPKLEDPERLGRFYVGALLR